MAKIDITAQLNAASVDGILASANQIYDEKKGKFQTAVNEDLDKRLKEQDGRLERYHDDLVNEVNREVAETIETSQETIDQLKEASEWLKNDPSGAQAIMEQTNQNTANIATIGRNTGIDEYPQFSTGMDYAIGDVVLYDGVLFRFKTDHAKGEWDYNEVEPWSEKREREEKIGELREELFASIPDIKCCVSNISQAIAAGASAGDTVLIVSSDGTKIRSIKTVNDSLDGFSSVVLMTEDKLFRIDGMLAINDNSGYWMIDNLASVELSTISGKPTEVKTFGYDPTNNEVWYRTMTTFGVVASTRVGRVKLNKSSNIIYNGKVYQLTSDGLKLTTIQEDVNEVKQSAERVNPIIDAVDKLGWKYKYHFDGKSSVATLKEPIVLAKDGDSIEFQVSGDLPETVQTGGYGFFKGGSPSSVGIGIALQGVYVRADDSSWVFQWQGGIGKGLVKIAYEYGAINLYIDGVLKATHEGYNILTLLAMGSRGSSYPLFFGDLEWVKINEEVKDIAVIATLEDVQLVSDNTSFMTNEEKKVLYGNVTNEMYIQKTSSLMNVYIRRPNGSYIGYPLTYNLNTQSGVFCDQWGLKKVFAAELKDGKMVDNGNLFYNSEAELAMKLSIDGSTVFVGGLMHGFENIVGGTQAGGDNTAREITFIIDNEKTSEGSTISLKPCKSIEVIQHTYLYPHDKNASPFADVVKIWNFSKDGVYITTKMNVNTEMTFLNCYFGMFGVLRRWEGSSENQYLVNSIIKNNEPYKVYDVSDGWSNSTLSTIDKNCTKMTAYGEMGFGFSIEIENSNIDIAGMMCSHNNNPYNKMYYGFATDNNPLNFKGEWKATQKWRIY